MAGGIRFTPTPTQIQQTNLDPGADKTKAPVGQEATTAAAKSLPPPPMQKNDRLKNSLLSKWQKAGTKALTAAANALANNTGEEWSEETVMKHAMTAATFGGALLKELATLVLGEEQATKHKEETEKFSGIKRPGHQLATDEAHEKKEAQSFFNAIIAGMGIEAMATMICKLSSMAEAFDKAMQLGLVDGDDLKVGKSTLKEEQAFGHTPLRIGF
jgi:hypothetical protein